MSLSYRILRGQHVTTALDDLARLRIEVFRDWPYLYDGSLEYERNYMASYADKEGAVLVAAFSDSQIVGAATGTPMEDHADDFQKVFANNRYALTEIFYCAESVLLPEFRGRGAGHIFFDEREAHARRLGRTYAAFCAVIRPEDHPRRPANYRPLDTFWRKRGYAPLPGAVAEFTWKDLDESQASSKQLQFWIKTL